MRTMTDKDIFAKTWKKDRPYPLCRHLPNNIISEMKKDSIDTQKDKLEKGFFICSSTKYYQDMNENNTKMTEKCIGEECEVSIGSECPPNTKKVGVFHTHYRFAKDIPSYADPSLPSYSDALIAKFSGPRFHCIGTYNKIRCAPSAGNPFPPRPVLEGIKLQKEYDRYIQKWKEKAVDCIIMTK